MRRRRVSLSTIRLNRGRKRVAVLVSRDETGVVAILGGPERQKARHHFINPSSRHHQARRYAVLLDHEVCVLAIPRSLLLMTRADA
jgi:hypothetical protein